ncbi:hypothetical protein EON65_29115 [archaeon]|nr:MAG: hypothetical protein EON65_29115 [archaeon]
MYSWLEQMQLPYSFTFILNDQRADVTEPIRSQLVAEYTQHIGEATRMLDAYKQLLRSITRQDLSVLAEGESVRNMLSYFQLDDRPGAHNSAISSTDTILKAFTSVSLLINGGKSAK